MRRDEGLVGDNVVVEEDDEPALCFGDAPVAGGGRPLIVLDYRPQRVRETALQAEARLVGTVHVAITDPDDLKDFRRRRLAVERTQDAHERVAATMCWQDNACGWRGYGSLLSSPLSTRDILTIIHYMMSDG